MQNLIKNPLFRIIGIAVILYYALFSNKRDPDSLANRLAPERVKSNLSDISNKSVHIIENLQKVEAIKQQQNEREKESSDQNNIKQQ